MICDSHVVGSNPSIFTKQVLYIIRRQVENTEVVLIGHDAFSSRE